MRPVVFVYTHECVGGCALSQQHLAKPWHRQTVPLPEPALWPSSVPQGVLADHVRIAETRVITSVRWVGLVIVIEIANQSYNYNHGLKISGLWSLNEWHLEGPKSLYIKNKDHSVILPSPMPLYKVNLDFLSSHLKLLINKTLQSLRGLLFSLGQWSAEEWALDWKLAFLGCSSGSARNLLHKYKLAPYLQEP